VAGSTVSAGAALAGAAAASVIAAAAAAIAPNLPAVRRDGVNLAMCCSLCTVLTLIASLRSVVVYGRVPVKST
jgi:hypothetical protein